MHIKKWLALIIINLSVIAQASAAINMSDLTQATPRILTTKTGKIEYYRFGKGAPAIVLISGYAANVSSWNRKFLIELAQHNQVVVFDNRNVGGSHASGPYTSTSLANDTDALITQLHLQKPGVVGISMGGMIAQQLAVLHPHDLSSLTLINTAMAGSKAVPPSSKVQQLITHTPKGKVRRFIIAMRLMAPPLWWIKVMHELKTDRFNPSGHQEMGITQATLGEQQQLVAGWLGNNAAAKQIAALRLPVLILNGEKDALIPPVNSEILAKTITQAKLKRWPNGGHMMTYQFPNSIAQAIVQFVNQNKA